MLIFIKAVACGAKNSFIIGDMPFMSYNLSIEQGLENAGKMIKAGANAIKLEGCNEHIISLVKRCTESGIPVLAHIGLTPQLLNTIGGYKIQGKTADDINTLLDLGYTTNEINIFYEKIPNSISVIVGNSYNKNITNYITLNYFNEENLDRYIKYDNDANKLDSVYNTDVINDNYTYEDTVTFVNAYLDKDYYTNDINLTNEEANNLDVIVNKYYKLNSDYEPDAFFEYAILKVETTKQERQPNVPLYTKVKKSNIKPFAKVFRKS